MILFKSSLIAGTLVLVIPCAVFAANPFADVPAGHWAYDSISKLAAAGVVEGYGDDTFRGERLMTRYEMAQIVAKAMSKGANVERLAAEFADELQSLGLRVNSLEKKSDNVKITGEVRAHFASISGSPTSPKYLNQNRSEELRTRLTFNGKVNDNWDYVARLENIQYLDDNHGDEFTAFQHAYLKGRLGGAKVIAGRFNLVRDDFGNIYDDEFDGFRLSYGNKYRIGGYYGKPATFDHRKQIGTVADGEGWRKAFGVDFSASLGRNWDFYAGFDKFTKNENGFADNPIYDFGLTYSVGKMKLGGSYYKSRSDSAKNTNGFVVSFLYNRVVPQKAGSWDFGLNYYKLGDGVNIINGMNGNSEFFTERFKNVSGGGFKGYRIGLHYAFAKNIVWGSEYYYLKGIDNSHFTSKSFWNELKFFF